MPFALRPYPRFPMQCSITYNAGMFQGPSPVRKSLDRQLQLSADLVRSPSICSVRLFLSRTVQRGIMKVPLIALLLTQLVVLTGCYEAKVLSDTFSSTREVPVTINRIWDIHEPNRRLLLVMVHGFNSSNDEAWGDFPRIIKSEMDTAFSGFNVLRYGYGSAACRNEVAISDRGDGLRSFLSDELKNYDGMIIVGHSLGDLVAMHGLIKLAKAHHPDLARIPVTVMTFGTPYSGVPGAELLGKIAFVCTDKQAEAVTVFNRSLRDLKVDWESYFGNNETKYRVTIKPFYGPADSFVAQDNACGPFPGCEQAVDGENHVMIVKPSDTNHSAYTKLRVQVDSMTDLIYGPAFAKRSPPSSKDEQKLNPINTTNSVPSNSITKPRMADDPATLLKTCGDLSLAGLTTKPKIFVPEWIPYLNTLRDEKIIHDFQTLMQVRGRRWVKYGGGLEEVRQANFTLDCLEINGYLKTETLDTPNVNMIGGEFKNRKIVFLKPIPKMIIPE